MLFSSHLTMMFRAYLRVQSFKKCMQKLVISENKQDFLIFAAKGENCVQHFDEGVIFFLKQSFGIVVQDSVYVGVQDIIFR